MQYFYKVCFYCAIVGVLLLEASLADKEEESNETSEVVRDDSKIGTVVVGDDKSSEGLPDDSHEAMNNRDTISNPITRDRRKKRSYEFLMGLINNNSRYQVTRNEPTSSPSNSMNLTEKQVESNERENDDNQSEILLELLVKIAANPGKWKKVHQLLRNIDEDIETSKQLLEKYHNHTVEIHNLIERNEDEKKSENENKTKFPDEKKRKYVQEEINKEIAMSSDNGQPYLLSNYEITSTLSSKTTTNKEWPSFEEENTNGIKFVQKNNNHETISTKTTYPKIFSYHRVTDKPIFVNKKPKAYVAVSVLAPKSTSPNDEDLELEHELIQLKPWSHFKNLKNMESIRSRWVIDTSKEKT